MTLSIIIVSYNTSALTLQAVSSAWSDAQSSPLLKGKTEIIVIDNNSSDDSVKALREAFDSPHIQIIKNKDNVGFAKANNQGIAQSSGKYIFLLNSDTMVQHGALELLVTTMEQNEKLGVLTATLLNEDGTIQPQGGSFPTLWSLFCHMSMLDDLPLIGKLFPSTQHTGLRQTEKLQYQLSDARLLPRDWVGATAVLIRKEVFEEIDPLDENIFMYGEDIEFCMRAHNHHWQVAIHPLARVTHLGNASGSSTRAIIGELEGYYYIWSKHKPLWQRPLVTLILKLGALQRAIIFGTIAPDSKKQKAYREFFFQKNP